MLFNQIRIYYKYSNFYLLKMRFGVIGYNHPEQRLLIVNEREMQMEEENKIEQTIKESDSLPISSHAAYCMRDIDATRDVFSDSDSDYEEEGCGYDDQFESRGPINTLESLDASWLFVDDEGEAAEELIEFSYLSTFPESSY
jgi:hypothetical protein